MKKLILSIAIVLLSISWMHAQAPEGFNYQAVVRDAMNQPISNQAVSLRISILTGSSGGSSLYTETHLVNSSDLGVIALVVGSGQVQSGSFNAINWANGSYWMQVEMDASGGNSFQLLGSSQLVSVPFALHAQTVTDKDDADADPVNELQTLTKLGDQLVLSQNGGSVSINDNDSDPLNEIQNIVKIGNQVMLTLNGGSFIDEVNDNDANPTNELQTLSFDSNTNQLSISNGNSVAIPTGGMDADADPTNELQTISKTGSVVSLSNGGGSFNDDVNDADANPNNELQTIVKNGSIVTLSNGGGSFTDEVNDADSNPGNELQNLTFNPTTNELSITNGNSVVIPTGGTDADADPTNEIQILTKQGNTVTLSNGGGSFTDEVNDADSNPSNEIQVLSKNGTLVSLSNGGGSFTDEVNDADSNPSNEIQILSKTGSLVTLSNGGGSFDDEVNDADSDPTNEIQTLTLNGTFLDLSGSGIVDLAPILPPGGSDDQLLTLNNNTLSIEDGNSVDLSAIASPWQNVSNGIEYRHGFAQIRDSLNASLALVMTPEFVASTDINDYGYFLKPSSLKFQSLGGDNGVTDITRNGINVYAAGIPITQRAILEKSQLHIFDGDLSSKTTFEDLTFEDAQLGDKTVLDRDSLYLFEPSVGLLFPQEGIVKPWGAEFKLGDGITRASYAHWGSEMVGYENIAAYGPAGLEVVDHINPNDAFIRFSLLPDSLSMTNGQKSKVVKLGTESGFQNGALHLFSGVSDKKIATLGAFDPEGNYATQANGELRLYDQEGIVNASLSGGPEGGRLWTQYDTLYASVADGNFASGVLVDAGGGLQILEDKFAAGRDFTTNNGFMSIFREGFVPSAGMEIALDRACVFSDGCFEIRLPNSTTGTTLMSYDEISLFDENGSSAVSLYRDIFNPAVGYIHGGGASGNLNFYAGANFIDGDLDAGMYSVSNAGTGDLAGMRVGSSGYSRVWSNGDIVVQNDNASLEFSRMGGLGFEVNQLDQDIAAQMSVDIFTDDGFLNLYDGSNSSINVVAGQDPYPGACDGCGYIAIYDSFSVPQAGFYIDEFGFGNVFADLKPFRMDHPEEKDKEIWYVALEGPEAAAYVRGTAELVNGEAFVPFPDHFKYVANPETMTAIVTPLSIDTYGLAVVEKTREGIIVKELKGGTGNFEFDWEVKCVRQGHEEFKVVRDKTNYPHQQSEQAKYRYR
ncbi:MAG: hypothetical protein R2792_07945 [Saprospiraceae bacterium]